MDTELQKRIKESAKNYAIERMGNQYPLVDSEYRRRSLVAHDNFALEEAYLDGAEHGYKEAIAQACEWLIDNLGYYNYDAVRFGESLWECIAKDFRKAMTEKTNPLFEKCLANINPETRAEVRKNIEKQIMEHTFKFTEGTCPDFECNFEMPAMLYDRLREVVKEFYEEGLYE